VLWITLSMLVCQSIFQLQEGVLLKQISTSWRLIQNTTDTFVRNCPLCNKLQFCMHSVCCKCPSWNRPCWTMFSNTSIHACEWFRWENDHQDSMRWFTFWCSWLNIRCEAVLWTDRSGFQKCICVQIHTNQPYNFSCHVQLRIGQITSHWMAEIIAPLSHICRKPITIRLSCLTRNFTKDKLSTQFCRIIDLLQWAALQLCLWTADDMAYNLYATHCAISRPLDWWAQGQTSKQTEAR